MMETFKEANGEQQSIRRGKLNLVDLAGSERQSKTGASTIVLNGKNQTWPSPWILVSTFVVVAKLCNFVAK